tara:strand:+ start:994 stop:1242 length:249 start_codon:yes stop_codon:yes gene_type:complete
MSRCIFFDTTDGCRLLVVEGIPSDETCNRCTKYQGPPRGLGDRIASVTRATGVDTLVEKVTGGKCGCEGRRQKLNQRFPSES